MQHLKASFTVVKSFANDLSRTIERFERITDHTVMTIQEVEKKLQSAAQSDK